MPRFRRKHRGERRSSLDEIIDLTTDPSAADPRAGGSRRSSAVWGMPGACPRCGDYGYLDHIDLINEVMLQHCPTCWHRWKVSKAETLSH